MHKISFICFLTYFIVLPKVEGHTLAYNYNPSDTDNILAELRKGEPTPTTANQDALTHEFYLIKGNEAFEKFEYIIADSFYNLALVLSSTDSTKIQLYLKKGEILVRQNNFENLLTVLNPLTTLFKNPQNDPFALYTFYALWAIYYQFEDDFINELDYLIKAKNLLKPSQLSEILYINRCMSIIYFRLQDFESSLRFFKENLSLAQKVKDDYNIIYSMYGVADCNLQLKRYSKSKEYCLHAIEVSRRSGITKAFGFIYQILGSVYIQDQKLDSAYYYIEKGINLSKQQKENKELSDNYVVMIDLLLIQGDTLEAQFYAEEALKIRSFHDSKLNSNLASIYASQGKLILANELLRKNQEYNEQLNDKNYIFSIASKILRDKFEQEKAIQVQLEKQKFEKQQISILLSVALLLLTLLLFIVIILVVHKKRIQNVNKVLLEKNDELQHFAYICSHDLKESIRNVGSFSSLIKSKLKKEKLQSDYNKYFNILEMGVSTLTSIVESLRIYTKINQTKEISKAHIIPAQVLESVRQSLFQLVKERQVSISISNEIGTHQVYTAESELFLIFQNIIQNAIKHNDSEDILVDINIFKKNDDVVVSIKDNGPGISSNYFDYIFEPFKTLKNKSISNASGLGLAICSKLANNIGSKIWLESEMGRGSTFYISLG